MLGYVDRALALLPAHDLATRWRLMVVREDYLLYQDDRQAHAAALSELAELAERLDDDARRVEVAHRQAAAWRTARATTSPPKACAARPGTGQDHQPRHDAGGRSASCARH